MDLSNDKHQVVLLGFSKSRAHARYQRLLSLEVLCRHTTLNHAKLGLTPLLKLYDRTDHPTDVEKQFSTWEMPLTPNQHLHSLVVPTRSSFWYDHSAQDVFILHCRMGGINIDQFDDTRWSTQHLPQSLDQVLPSLDVPPSHWELDYTVPERLPLTTSDIHLLKSLSITAERHTTCLMPRSHLTSRRYAAERLHQLRSAGVFQTFFKLYYVGLQVRYYLLAISSASHLEPLAQFVCQLPRYQVWKGVNCLFALLWLTPELQELVQCFLSSLQSLDLSVLFYGKINTDTRAHSPNLPALWNEKTCLWYSEPEW